MPFRLAGCSVDKQGYDRVTSGEDMEGGRFDNAETGIPSTRRQRDRQVGQADVLLGCRVVCTETNRPLLENLAMVAEFGYCTDHLEVALRLVDGPEETNRKALSKIRHKEVVARGKNTVKLWEKIKKENKIEETAGFGSGG